MACAGIDVGSSTSCIALARKGGVDVLLNKESKRETPSIVTFGPKRRQLGTDAVGALSTNPRNTISCVKRLIGKQFNDPMVQEDIKYFPFHVVPGPSGECAFEVQYLDKPAVLTGEQILGALLVDLRTTAEREQGGPVSEAVLAVPTYATEPERHGLLAAAQIAGLNCLRLLNETTATALAYGIYKTDLPEGAPTHVAFVDIGFSSTQVCVVALKKGQLQVLSNAWDRNLGGRDFDNAIFEHFAAEFGEKYKLDIKSNARASYRLRLACEKMKKVLTTNPEAPINVECLMNDMDAVHSVMTRDTFEELSKPILDRLVAPIRKAVEDAGLTPEAVASVEVVGGTSRVPAVVAIIRDYFGREPSRTLNAKETVSRGCALQCAMLSPTFNAKMLTFYRSEPFSISAEYTPDSDIPATAGRAIGSWDVGPFRLPAGADRVKIKVKVSLNLNGVVAVESAQLIEEEEYEEEVPVAPAAPKPAAAGAAADQPMADAAGAAGDEVAPGAEGGEEEAAADGGAAAGAPDAAPMEQEAAPAADAAPATQKVLKRRVKKHSVPFVTHTAAPSAERLQQLYEAECEMALQARVQEETNDAKNALESYIYGLRNALCDRLAPYVPDAAKASLQSRLDDMENWLYDEGEDQAKSVYVAKLGEVQVLGGPIERRAEEAGTRPAAAAALRATAEGYLTAATAAGGKYAHIDAADKAKVVDEANKALAWLAEKEGVQAPTSLPTFFPPLVPQSLHKYDEPALVVADIAKKADTLKRFADPILSKPPPPPPKAEAAPPAADAAPAPPAEGEQMETDADAEAVVGPQPAAEEEPETMETLCGPSNARWNRRAVDLLTLERPLAKRGQHAPSNREQENKMDTRLQVLASVADALLPALPQRAEACRAEGDALSAQMYDLGGGASPDQLLKVINVIETQLTPQNRSQLYLLLRLLNSRLGTLLLLGRDCLVGGLPRAYVDLPRTRREAALRAWSASPRRQLRLAFKGLKNITMSVLFTALSPKGRSPLLEAMRYAIVDPCRPPAPAPPAAAAEAAVAAALVDLSAADGSPGGVASAAAVLSAKGVAIRRAGAGGQSRRRGHHRTRAHCRFPDHIKLAAVKREKPALVIKADAVVVGSGAGGGVAAARLAAAGLQAVVLEKAGFVPAAEMTLQEGQSFETMYERGGILSSEDGSVSILAGATLGGGTRINWREWAEELGLSAFASPKYDASQDAVFARTSVRGGFVHPPQCATLRDGLAALGVHHAEVARNCLSPDCGGHCCFGCARGYKQDTVNTWLADACQDGARVLTGVYAERVLMDGSVSEAAGPTRGRRAVGVLCHAGHPSAPLRFAVQAPVVVSSCGSINTPALLLRRARLARLLPAARPRSRAPAGSGCSPATGPCCRARRGVLVSHTRHAIRFRRPCSPCSPAACACAPATRVCRRSGIKCRGNVGANLRLHPATCVVGVFPPEAGADARPGAASGAAAAATPPAGAGGAPAEQRRIDMSGRAAGPGRIRCWEGTIINHVGHWEDGGYGALLYTPAVHPGLFAAAAPWIGGQDFKDLVLQARCDAGACASASRPAAGVACRTRRPSAVFAASGLRTATRRVVIDREGRPRIHYSLSKRDEGSMLAGVELALRCLGAAGAHTVLTLLNSPDGRFSFGGSTGALAGGSGSAAGKQAAAKAVAARTPGEGPQGAGGAGPAGAGRASAGGGDPDFEGFLAGLRAQGVPPLQYGVFCAHQMGSARLGVDPASSALDPAGECWEVEGLFCLDGAAFPTPTGINPMMTIEAIAHMLGGDLAQRAAAALRARGERRGRRGAGGAPLAYDEDGGGGAAAAARL
eukprot:scaffold21.g2220.t1